MNVFHPSYDNLFVLGLFQTDTGNWPIMDYQAQLVSRFIHAQERAPRKADAFRTLKATARPALAKPGLQHSQSPKFAIEVEYFSYRAQLKRLIARMAVTGSPARQVARRASAPSPTSNAAPAHVQRG
jgi:hypothetical protein